MRYLYIQIQPERSPGIDMPALHVLFHSMKDRIDLVRSHAFESGQDDGAYFGFTFGSERPADLWRHIQNEIFRAPEHSAHLAASAMVVCSSENGWHRYSMLHHWDPSVPVVSTPDL